MDDNMIRLVVKVKRGKRTLGKSALRFCEGAHTADELQKLYVPVIARRALQGAVDAGVRGLDGEH